MIWRPDLPPMSRKVRAHVLDDLARSIIVEAAAVAEFDEQLGQRSAVPLDQSAGQARLRNSAAFSTSSGMRRPTMSSSSIALAPSITNQAHGRTLGVCSTFIAWMN
jgi:hypothetical protein